MGKRVTVTLFDDLNPELEAETERTFTIDGMEYHLDLSQKNAEQFDSELDKWIQVATSSRVGRTRTPAKRSSSSKNTYSGGEAGLPLAEIRAWAQEKGIEIADRGRVSAEVVRAWKADQEAPAADNKPAAKKATPAKKTANETDPNFSHS